MATPGTANTTVRIRTNSDGNTNERRTITFYLLRGLITFQSRRTERNSLCGGHAARQCNWKLNVTVEITSIGWPPLENGRTRHCFTAAMAASASVGDPPKILST